jgi:hypothetical protein
MKSLFKYMSTVLFILILTGCGGTAIYNIDNSNTITSKSSIKQIETAIKKGALRKSWSVKKEKEGLLTATINVRGRHIAVVSISYDAKGYKINYKDSQGLDYDASSNTIHKNYNKWITSLERNINYELAQIGIHQNSSAIQTTNPVSQPVVTKTTTATTNLKKSGDLNLEGKTIYIKSIIPYSATAPVAPNIKTECIIDQQLSEFIISSAKASGLNIVAKNDIGKNDIELKVEIVDAVSQGGAFRGHNKYVSISGVLVQGDKSYQSFKAARISGGGFWGAYKGSCAVLGRTVEALGKDVGVWLSSPIDGARLGDLYLIR